MQPEALELLPACVQSSSLIRVPNLGSGHRGPYLWPRVGEKTCSGDPCSRNQMAQGFLAHTPLRPRLAEERR